MDAKKKIKNTKERSTAFDNFRRADMRGGRVCCKADFIGVPMGADIMSYPKNVLCLGLDKPTSYARP